VRVEIDPGEEQAMNVQTRRPKAKRALPKGRATPATAPADVQRSRRGAETRARLVKAAKEVFERDGFLEARISDIAKRAKVSYGAFYHYFDSKEEIFREVAEAQEDRLTAPPDEGSQPAPTDLSPQERIHRANRRYLERYRSEARIMGVIEQVSRYDPYVNAARMASMKHFVERSERAIQRLQASGKADARLDPALASDALGAMVARFAELWLTQGYRKYDFDEAVDQLSLLWANAIGLTDRPSTRQPRKRKSTRY
jgi:AcrR family transcriptional regulator